MVSLGSGTRGATWRKGPAPMVSGTVAHRARHDRLAVMAYGVVSVGRTLQRFGAVATLMVFAAACSSDDDLEGPLFEAPETAVSYEVELTGMPDEALTALAQDALGVYRQQDDGAQSVAFLKRRAKSDVPILEKILRSRGYYQSEIDVGVERLEPETPEDVQDADSEEDPPEERAVVTITVEPGKAFTLARHDFLIDDQPAGAAPEFTPDAFGSPVGQQALAADIIAAEAGVVRELRSLGFPYADETGRRAVADPEAATIEVDSQVATGPAAVFGSLDFEGLEDVRERYLLTYLPWEAGDTFDRAKLRDFQRELLSTDLFDALSVRPPEDPPPAEDPFVALPVTVTVEEREARTVSAGARYSTDEGPSVTAGFEHRNLWGENETLTLSAGVGLERQFFGIGYREPQYMRNGQDLTAGLILEREEDDAFDELSATATVGLERELTPRWTVGAGGLVEVSFLTDDGVDSEAYLGGIPVFAEYDGSNDLLNPTEGIRFRLDAIPFFGIFDDEFASFLVLDAIASTYLDLTGSGDYVLALRGRTASILTDELDTVPANRRLYSGGGGSVRGYAQRFVGPLDGNNDPVGGLSALEGAVEMRARLFGDLGGVLFVDAGSVSTESFPNFEEDIQVAAGVGFRYYSPAGPIRLDVAFPVNGRDADDSFQFYISIGQAF